MTPGPEEHNLDSEGHKRSNSVTDYALMPSTPITPYHQMVRHERSIRAAVQEKQVPLKAESSGRAEPKKKVTIKPKATSCWPFGK